MEKSFQVIKVEEYVYRKCIRNYGVKRKKKRSVNYIYVFVCVNKLN